VTRATFECAPELNADKVCDLTDLAVEEIGQNKMTLKDGVFDYTVKERMGSVTV